MGSIEVDGVPIPRAFGVSMESEVGDMPTVRVDMYAREGVDLEVLADVHVCVTHLVAGSDQAYFEGAGLVLVSREKLREELDRMTALGMPVSRDLYAAASPSP